MRINKVVQYRHTIQIMATRSVADTWPYTPEIAAREALRFNNMPLHIYKKFPRSIARDLRRFVFTNLEDVYRTVVKDAAAKANPARALQTFRNKWLSNFEDFENSSTGSIKFLQQYADVSMTTAQLTALWGNIFGIVFPNSEKQKMTKEQLVDYVWNYYEHDLTRQMQYRKSQYAPPLLSKDKLMMIQEATSDGPPSAHPNVIWDWVFAGNWNTSYDKTSNNSELDALVEAETEQRIQYCEDEAWFPVNVIWKLWQANVLDNESEAKKIAYKYFYSSSTNYFESFMMADVPSVYDSDTEDDDTYDNN